MSALRMRLRRLRRRGGVGAGAAARAARLAGFGRAKRGQYVDGRPLPSAAGDAAGPGPGHGSGDGGRAAAG